jgi:hypothetical protein
VYSTFGCIQKNRQPLNCDCRFLYSGNSNNFCSIFDEAFDALVDIVEIIIVIVAPIKLVAFDLQITNIFKFPVINLAQVALVLMEFNTEGLRAYKSLREQYRYPFLKS